MRPRASFKSAKALCFDTISNVTVKFNQVRETGPSNKHVGTQLNDTLKTSMTASPQPTSPLNCETKKKQSIQSQD